MFATCGNDKVVRVYDEMTRKIVTELSGTSTGQPGHSNRVFCVKFAKEDENLMISGGWDNNIFIWDLRQGTPVRSIYGPKICGDSLDIYDDYILSGAYQPDNQLHIWKLSTGESLFPIDWNAELPSPEPCSVYSAQFEPKYGTVVVAGGAGYNEVKVFDVHGTSQLRPVAQICELSRPVFSIDYSKDSDMIAMGGGEGVVRVFNVTKEF